MAHMTSTEAEQAFRELGLRGPSASTCDRLPKTISTAWEAQRKEFEAELRAGETVPGEAEILVASLDGVMVPDKAAQKEAKAKREAAAKKGLAKKTGGPAGYREAGCGTVSLYALDEKGKPKRLDTVRYGREPEHKKRTLTEQLDAEVASILAVRPDLKRVALADGAEENWRYFDDPVWDDAEKIVDFGHAAGHLRAGLVPFYGARGTLAGAPSTRSGA
jgi:hypothetical protein